MLKIMHINTTSIKKHRNELLATFSNYDIWTVNETNLKPHSNFSLPGYNLYRNDRLGKQGWGVLLAIRPIRNNIKCYEILNTTMENNETIAVQIDTLMGQLLIATVYVPPTARIHRDLFEHIYQLNNNCLITGDLSAALFSKGSIKTNSKGFQLQQILDDGYVQCIENDHITYSRNNYEEKIDWILASQPTIMFINGIEMHPPLGLKEDHKPMTFNLNMTADRKPLSPRLSYNFSKGNWKIYHNKLNELLGKIDINENLETEDQLETYAAKFTRSIALATKEAIPQTAERLKNQKNSNITKRLIEEKHRAYRQWKKKKGEKDKQRYYQARELLANSLRNERKEKLKSILTTFSAKKMQSDKVWNAMKKFHNKRTKQLYTGELTYLNTVAKNDQEKADLFAKYFENEIFTRKSNEISFQE